MIAFKAPSFWVLLLIALFGVAGLVYFFSARSAPGLNSQPAAPRQQGESPTENAPQSGRYQEYSQEAFIDAIGQRRVLFFYAPWCPTCRPLDRQLSENTNQIPEDVVIFRTDYDTNTELKDRYGVTYQHTFVQVDSDGEKIKIWNGGQLEDVLENIL